MHISATHTFTFLSLPFETTHNNILHLPTIYHSLHLFSQFVQLCSPLVVHQVTITVKIQDIRENTTRWLQHDCREIQMSTYSIANSTASILLTTQLLTAGTPSHLSLLRTTTTPSLSAHHHPPQQRPSIDPPDMV